MPPHANGTILRTFIGNKSKIRPKNVSISISSNFQNDGPHGCTLGNTYLLSQAHNNVLKIARSSLQDVQVSRKNAIFSARISAALDLICTSCVAFLQMPTCALVQSVFSSYKYLIKVHAVIRKDNSWKGRTANSFPSRPKWSSICEWSGN